MSAPEYARLVNQGNLAARDRFGVPIARGQLVEYRPEILGMGALIWQVMDVTPIMDPRLPGMIRVTLEGKAHLSLQVNVACHALRYHGEAQIPEQEVAPPKPEVVAAGNGVAGDVDAAVEAVVARLGIEDTKVAPVVEREPTRIHLTDADPRGPALPQPDIEAADYDEDGAPDDDDEQAH
jgi:hypothetical protein